MDKTNSSRSRNFYRTWIVLLGLASLQACGAWSALEHQAQRGDTSPTARTPAGNTASSSGTSTQAAQLSTTAAEVQSTQMQTYLSKCAQNPPCANDANQVSQTIGQAVTLLTEGKDATKALQAFDDALTQLVSCMQKNPPANGAPVGPPTFDAGDPNCTTQQSQGVTVTTCQTPTGHCVTQQQASGEVVQTCVSNPTAPTSPGSPTTGGTVTGSAPVTTPTGGSSTTGSATATTGGNTTGPDPSTTGGGTGTVTGGTAGSSTTGGTTGAPPPGGTTVVEKCSTQKLPDGSVSVTCTCNALNGSCSVEGSAP